MHCNIQAEIGQDMFKGVDKLLHCKIPVHRVRYVYLHCLRAEWGQLLFGCLIHCFISILCLHAVQTSSWFPLEPSLGENPFQSSQLLAANGAESRGVCGINRKQSVACLSFYCPNKPVITSPGIGRCRSAGTCFDNIRSIPSIQHMST